MDLFYHIPAPRSTIAGEPPRQVLGAQLKLCKNADYVRRVRVRAGTVNPISSTS